jgi:hypothetical protein
MVQLKTITVESARRLSMRFSQVAAVNVANQVKIAWNYFILSYKVPALDGLLQQ